MAVIPTFQRQQGLPRSTGMTGLPAVKIDDHIGNALGNFGQSISAVGNTLVLAQAEAEVSTATTTAQIQFAQLEANSAKEDGLVANQKFGDRALSIFEKASSIIATPQGKKAFQSKFNILSASSQVKVSAAGTARKFDQLKAGLITDLDTKVNLIKQNMSPGERLLIETSGLSSIDKMVKSGVIDATFGAKLKIKFKQDSSKNGILSWVNSQAKDSLVEVYDQMAEGVFKGNNAKQNAADWSNLNEKERNTLRNGVATELRSLQAQQNANDRKSDKENKLDQEETTSTIASMIQMVSIGEELPNNQKLPTLRDIELFKTNRKITGPQAMTLGKMLVAMENAKTDEPVLLRLQNEIYDIADLSPEDQTVEIANIKRQMMRLSEDGRLEASHGSSLTGLINKVLTAGYKHSPEARARKSLGHLLGAQDQEFTLSGINPDPGAANRIQNALNEYDARMDEGEEKAWDVHSDLLKRARIELPGLNSFVKPQFGSAKDLDEWASTDVTETSLKLATALKEKKITKAAFNASAQALSQIGAIIANNKRLDTEEKNRTKDAKTEADRRKKD
tara:strand:+ start:1207 stop:2898 length:1692 start_codon:yes stop_codon:yes gene_type:complete